MAHPRVKNYVEPLRLLELTCLFVRFNHVASFIVNANHSVMRAAVKLRVADCVADCVRLAVPQATKRQRTGNQIKAALVAAWAHFINVRF